MYIWSSTDFRLKIKHGHDGWIRSFACLMGSGRVAVANRHGVWMIEIRDEGEQGGSVGSNELSISTAD